MALESSRKTETYAIYSESKIQVARMTPSILITHPGRQHSHHFALALDEVNLLKAYWTGVPVADPDTKGLLYRGIAHASPQPVTSLNENKVHHFYLAPIVRRIAESVCSPSNQVYINHRAYAWFDRWVALHLSCTIETVSAVVCYENAAKETFRVAKKYGLTTILDAASLHHTKQDVLYVPTESKDAHKQIVKIKNEEIDLSDHIITVSELARKSYVEAGVDPKKVSAVPMGVNIESFSCSYKNTNRDRPFLFLFVGHARQLKGIDILIEASNSLIQIGDYHELALAGGIEKKFSDDVDRLDHVQHMGYLTRSELGEIFRKVDCLVLPSRFDSFGRVVVEALATGTPVIVSSNVGAKECIKQGINGWIVKSGSTEALVKRMRWCINHRDKLLSMVGSARRTAEKYSWRNYRKKIAWKVNLLIT